MTKTEEILDKIDILEIVKSNKKIELSDLRTIVEEYALKNKELKDIIQNDDNFQGYLFNNMSEDEFQDYLYYRYKNKIAFNTYEIINVHYKG